MVVFSHPSLVSPGASSENAPKKRSTTTTHTTLYFLNVYGPAKSIRTSLPDGKHEQNSTVVTILITKTKQHGRPHYSGLSATWGLQPRTHRRNTIACCHFRLVFWERVVPPQSSRPVPCIVLQHLLIGTYTIRYEIKL